MSTYVPTPDQISPDDIRRMRQRLIEQINSDSDANLRIAFQSEASLKKYVTDIFRSIAALFGYVIGSVVGFVEDTVRGIRKGFGEGFNTGRGQPLY